MEYRQLGSSRRVPALSFGTGTFGGCGPLLGRSVPQVAIDWLLHRPCPPYPHTPYRQQEGFARLHPPLV